MPLDMDITAYLIKREEVGVQGEVDTHTFPLTSPPHSPSQARQRRLQTNYLAANVDSIEARIAAAEGLRETWRQWNPQREAAKKLEQMVLDGTITLEVGAWVRTVCPHLWDGYDVLSKNGHGDCWRTS